MHSFKSIEIYFKSLSNLRAIRNGLHYVESQIGVLESYQYFGQSQRWSRMLLRAAQIGID